MSRPIIQIDDVIREMNDDEFVDYELRQSKLKEIDEANKTAKQNRNVALAKLEALGLNENDFKALGL